MTCNSTVPGGARSKTYDVPSHDSQSRFTHTGYKNPVLSPARSVQELLTRMTIEEKAAQRLCL